MNIENSGYLFNSWVSSGQGGGGFRGHNRCQKLFIIRLEILLLDQVFGSSKVARTPSTKCFLHFLPPFTNY